VVNVAKSKIAVALISVTAAVFRHPAANFRRNGISQGQIRTTTLTRFSTRLINAAEVNQFMVLLHFTNVNLICIIDSSKSL